MSSSPEALAKVVKDSLDKAREGGDSRAYSERLEELVGAGWMLWLELLKWACGVGNGQS